MVFASGLGFFPGVLAGTGFIHGQGRMTTEEKKGIKGKSAFELFPDIMKSLPGSRKEGAEDSASAAKKGTARIVRSRVEPPKPPDITTLLAGEKRGAAHGAEAETALLLMADGRERDMVAVAMADLGYVVESAVSQLEAVEKMGSANIGAVVLEDGFQGEDLAHSHFHRFMKSLPMDKRRYIYYVLVGPAFHTMYDLQALAESANLVVNRDHVPKFDLLFRRGLRQYEELFGLYVEQLQLLGRR